LKVAENIAFGLRLKKIPKQEVEKRVREALMNVQMSDDGNRYPRQLSGGQQQRVAHPAVVFAR
jgi:ABC-type sugar transport system ATPase subunit